MTKRRRRSDLAIRAAIWVAALAPAAWLGWLALRDGLGANPIEEVTHQTGWWALTLVTVTLAITPMRRLTGWNRIIRFRRLVGLFAFFYATLHLLTYVVLDQFFALDFILEDIAERPFITVGFAAWVVLLALATTSTRGWIRRLGRWWGRLHRMVYVAAGLGAVHFFWKVKADTREPLIFAGVIGVLLVLRLPSVRRFGRRLRQRAPEGRVSAPTGTPAQVAYAPDRGFRGRRSSTLRSLTEMRFPPWSITPSIEAPSSLSSPRNEAPARVTTHTLPPSNDTRAPEPERSDRMRAPS